MTRKEFLRIQSARIEAAIRAGRCPPVQRIPYSFSAEEWREAKTNPNWVKRKGKKRKFVPR